MSDLVHDLEVVLHSAIPNCKLCQMLETMPDTESEAVREAIRGKIKAASLERVLHANGWDISDSAIRRHTKKGH